MNIDWDCKSVEGKDYCFVNKLSLTMVFQNYAIPPSNAAMWTLHERPKAEQMKETFYTKEMYETGELPKAGMKCSFFAGTKLGGGDFVEGTCLSVAKKSNGANVIMFEYTHNDSMPIDCTLFSNKWVKPIDKDKEKAIDDLSIVIENYNKSPVEFKSGFSLAEWLLNDINDNQIHGITFTGDK